MTRLCRLIAMAIAVMAAIDPQVSGPGPAALRVGVRVATAAPSPAVERWIAALVDRLPAGAVVARDHAAPEAPWCVGVDACVAVADGTVRVGGRPERPVHVVRVPPPAAPVVVAAATSPGQTQEMRDAHLAIAGGRADESIDLALDDRGVEVGRITHRRSAAPIDLVSLPWWPRDDGTRRLEVRVGAESVAAILAETSAVPLDVLVWEVRPSWTGTFVRRALEADRRLVVRAASQLAPRQVARRGVAGATPADAELEQARAVVVTGAGALSPAQVDRLVRLARGGGSVIVALDEAPAVAARALLPGPVTGQRHELAPVALGRGLRAAELVGFAAGDGEAVLAAWDGAPPGQRAVVVERRTGHGRLVVSGALDAWRWRDGAAGFEGFWREVVVRAARATSPALGVSWTPAAGADRLQVTSRRAIAAGRWPPLALVRACGDASERIPVVAGAVPGTWNAELRPPPPDCVVRATSGGTASEAVGLAPVTTLPAVPPRPAELEALATVSGGTMSVADAGAGQLAQQIAATPRPLVPTPWRPMRAWWWFVPLAAALGTEWWLRRRVGLP